MREGTLQAGVEVRGEFMITIQDYWKFHTLLLVVSVLLAAVLWWGWRRLSRLDLRPGIQMDGAYCQVAENGDVLIRPHTIRDFIVLAWVGAGLACVANLGFWFYNPWGVTLHQITWTWIEGLFTLTAMLLVGAAMLLFRSLGQTKIQVQVETRKIKWKRWFRNRRYSFEHVSYIKVLFYESMNISIHRTYSQRTAKPVSEIELILEDGSWILLGRLSGKNTENRALSIAQLIADTIGVPVRKTRNM
jgi:hypothetical protein